MSISSHASRWLVAAIAAPILIWVIFWAPPPFYYALVALFGALCWWEFCGICLTENSPALRALGIAGWVVVAAGAAFFDAIGQQAGLVLAVISGALFFVARFQRFEAAIDSAGRFMLGHAYISFLFSFLLLLHHLAQGPRWVLYLLLVTFLCDTSAYYAGKTFGRRPLYPALSPKKTWEGLLGGMVGGAIVAMVLAVVMMSGVVWWQAGLLGLVLGPWSAGGDLFESMFKRITGIKDSGRILMGHGGVWDRVDALLFNAPVIYFFALTQVGQ